MNMIRMPHDGAETARRLTRARQRLSDSIEHAIALPDALDGDPDAEPDGSDELSLQAEIRGGSLARAA